MRIFLKAVSLKALFFVLPVACACLSSGCLQWSHVGPHVALTPDWQDAGPTFNNIAMPPDIPVPPFAPESNLPAVDTPKLSSLVHWQEAIGALDAQKPATALLQQAVSQLNAMGLLETMNPSAEAFLPTAPITRAQLAQWLGVYLLVEPVTYQESPYTDVSASHPGVSAMEAMAKTGLIALPKGFKGQRQRFDPTGTVSREALCQLALALLGKNALPARTEASVTEFSAEPAATSQWIDASRITPAALPAVTLLYQQGLLGVIFDVSEQQLTQEQGFQPQKPATQQESLVLLHSVLGKSLILNKKKPDKKPV